MNEDHVRTNNPDDEEEKGIVEKTTEYFGVDATTFWGDKIKKSNEICNLAAAEEYPETESYLQNAHYYLKANNIVAPAYNSLRQLGKNNCAKILTAVDGVISKSFRIICRATWRIDGDSLKRLITFFDEREDIKILILQGHKLTNNDKDVLIQLVKHIQNLECLNLVGNKITKDFAKIIENSKPGLLVVV